jgi:RNA polymerase sigma factor (sigma-70 family)
MARSWARITGGRSCLRVGDLDVETLRLVQSYLMAPGNRRGCAPALVAAWDRFYHACDGLIRYHARRRRGQNLPYEDRVQEIWRILVAHLARYDPRRGSFPAWLACVVRHALDDQDRRHHPPRQLIAEVELSLPGREEDPAELCQQCHRRQEVRSALQTLRSQVSEQNYGIIDAHWIEGKSFGEIAATLGIPVKQVRDHHRRAIEKLRALLS